MPYTVNDCFEKFRKDVVDLEPGQTKTARGSRDFVYKNIGALFQKGLLPRMYPAMNLNFGSFDRKTKQGKLDDIDLMVCYDGLGGSYTTQINNKLYKIVLWEFSGYSAILLIVFMNLFLLKTLMIPLSLKLRSKAPAN